LDDAQGIFDFVGDAGGQLSQRSQPLALLQIFLQPFDFPDIPDDDQGTDDFIRLPSEQG
jgi:hypothetical protein